MNISSELQSLLDRNDIELDDVRWYCCIDLAERLLMHRKTPGRLVHLLWSGSIESELYRIEEQYLEQLDEDLSERRIDLAQVNGVLNNIRHAKQNRMADTD